MDSDNKPLVEDVMSTPLKTVPEDATVREAAKRMREHDINGLFIPGATSGIVTTTDIVDAVADGEQLDQLQVADVMTAPVERVTASLELSEAATMMTNFGIQHLPVIDEHRDYVGMVSSTDITNELA